MVDAGMRNRLLTFADIDDWAKRAFALWLENGRRSDDSCVFLDSGAYGAHTRGVTMDIGRYCDYIKGHHNAIDVYASLDVIGNWRASAKNLDIMCNAGLMPAPTFHLGSPMHELRRLAANYPYLALGGLVGSPSAVIKAHLDKCWAVLRPYWPIKTHVFGVTAQWALERYPFYSADSSSAIAGSGMGRVMRFEKGHIVSRPWVQDLRKFLDGSVADGVGGKEGAKSKSAHIGRKVASIKSIIKLERHVTDLWTGRGVTWDGAAYTGSLV